MKSVAYDFQVEHVLVATSNLLLKRRSPFKPICESLVVVQYIDEVWPAALRSSIDDDWFKKVIESLVREGDVEEMLSGLVVLEGRSSSIGCAGVLSAMDKARTSTSTSTSNLIDESNTPNLFKFVSMMVWMSSIYDFSKLLVSAARVVA